MNYVAIGILILLTSGCYEPLDGNSKLDLSSTAPANSNITSPMIQDGTIESSDLSTSLVSGLWSNISATDITRENGNVLIGISSIPATPSRLDISALSNTDIPLRVQGNNQTFLIRNSAATANLLSLRNDDSTDGNGVSLNFRSNANGLDSQLFGEIRGTFTTHTPKSFELSFLTTNNDAYSEKMKITSDGKVGIGNTTPSAKLDLFDSQDDPVGGVRNLFKSEYRGATTVNSTSYARAGTFLNYKKVSAGVTDSGYSIANWSAALRNINTTSDSGTLTSLSSQTVYYGHNNSDATATPITSTAYGISVTPYIRSGTITNMYDIFLGNIATGGTATNRWGIYQQNTSNNYFAGNIGIGVTGPTYQLQLSTDSAAKPGSGTWTIASDERLKDINGSFNKGLNEILGLNTIYFNYKKDNPLGLPSDKNYVGIRAQDAEKFIPEAVSIDEKGFLHINNDSIMWALVNAVKQIYKKFQSHDSLIESLLAENKKVLKKLEMIEAENAELKIFLCKSEKNAPFCKK